MDNEFVDENYNHDDYYDEDWRGVSSVFGEVDARRKFGGWKSEACDDKKKSEER